MIENKARFTIDILRTGCQQILKVKDQVLPIKANLVSANSDIHDTPAFDRKQAHSNDINAIKILQETTTSNQSMRA